MDSNLKLVFVGPDRGLRIPSGETITYEQFVQTTLPERCKSSIEYHGTLSHFEVMRLRKRAFVTISASRYEVLPYSILEAMSLGCPLIASAVGGIPEVIRDSANGLLVKPNDVTSLVVACRRLLDAPHLATNLGGQARQDCKQFFDPRKIAIETADAYREAIRFFESHSEQE
jgi:glycosyltransferase involved in cell wall biosynthesis